MQRLIQSLVFSAACVCASGQGPEFDGIAPISQPAALLQKQGDATVPSQFQFTPIIHSLPIATQAETKLPELPLAPHAHRDHRHRHRRHSRHHRHGLHHHHHGHHHHHKKHRAHRNHDITGALAFNLRAKAKHDHVDAWPWTKKKDEDVDLYGPEGCVQTYRDSKGFCVMETRCSKVDTSNYKFGLLCMLESGEKVEHDYGKGSFDPVERFNTLISCHKCLGLQTQPEDPAPKPKDAFAKMADLHDEVDGLTKLLAGVSATVTKLNGAIFPAGPSPAPAPGPAPGASPAPAAKEEKKAPAAKEEKKAPAAKAKASSFLDRAEALVTKLSLESAAKANATAAAKGTTEDEESDDID